jgi:hypothetical protein
MFACFSVKEIETLLRRTQDIPAWLFFETYRDKETVATTYTAAY